MGTVARQGDSTPAYDPLKLLQTRRFPASQRAGLTLVDLMIGSVVMIIAVLATIGTIQTTSALGESTRETTIAYQATRAMVEELQAQPFEDLFRRYNSDDTDNPLLGTLPSPGDTFAVDGMDLQATDLDGFAGQLRFPVDEFGVLREDLVAPEFGLPMDLNGDGIIDGDNRIDDHIRLPLRVRVDWTGNAGDRFTEFSTVLFRRS